MVSSIGRVSSVFFDHGRPPSGFCNSLKIFPSQAVSFSPTPRPHKSFRCNTYGSPRKCCKQKAYGLAKPFRCNTYKKPGGASSGSEAGSSQLDFNRAKCAVFDDSLLTSHLLIESGQQPLKEFSMSEATPSALTMPTRTESDSMGKLEVPSDRYYGAQTARSLIHFAILKDTIPPELIRAFGILKKAHPLVNQDAA